MPGTANDTRELDVLVVGGGIAGLWVLDRLVRQGFAAALVEQDRLGSGQTIAAQGMIHGGIKYALGGRLTRAAATVATMPGRWRACLEGRGEVDLRGTRLLADACHLWSGDGLGARLSALLAARALHGRVEPLARADYPAFFADPAFTGSLHRLDDPVIDPGSLLATLAGRHRGRTLALGDVAGRLQRSEGRFVLDADDLRLNAARLVLTAGAGNAELLAALGLARPEMQRRPLHQVRVELEHPHPVHAHCITGLRRAEPRLTLTSHPRGDGRPGWTWSLGGALASDGIDREPAAQIAFAREELRALVPWVDLSGARFSSARIDRAEARQADGRRPDGAQVHVADGVITAWPTKLTLAPDLGDRVLAAVGEPDAGSARRAAALEEALVDRRHPEVATGWTAEAISDPDGRAA
jgi:glycine/D-amino acid oxidase-like deaminating enzyme